MTPMGVINMKVLFKSQKTTEIEIESWEQARKKASESYPNLPKFLDQVETEMLSKVLSTVWPDHK